MIEPCLAAELQRGIGGNVAEIQLKLVLCKSSVRLRYHAGIGGMVRCFVIVIIFDDSYERLECSQ